MPGGRQHRLLVAIAWLALAPTITAAQDTPSSTSPAGTADAPASAVQQAKPDVYFLRDKDGKLQPVLGFTLEDFERLVGQADGGATRAKPELRLDKVSARGTADDDHAELTIDFTIHSDRTEGWSRLPLRLGGAVLHDKVKYQGPGAYELEFDDASGEYVAWLRGGGDKPHVLSMPVLVPLVTLAGERRMKLSVPRAPESELTLSVPMAKAAGEVSTGAVLEKVETRGDRTEFRVLGVGSDFELSWHAAQQTAATPAVLEATGSLLARIDGRTISTRAHLTVRSFGGEFDAFRVRLPQGAVLVSGGALNYTIHPIDDKDPKGRIVEVRLRNPGLVAEGVQLVAERAVETTKAQSVKVQIDGFQVLSAVRQTGHVAVQVVGDWHVVWDEARLARQVEEMPADLRREVFAAGFEYFSQPFLIAARMIRRETRVSVDPEYLLEVGARRVDLTARLRYRIGPTRAFAVEVDLPGWTFDSARTVEGMPVAIQDLAPGEVKPLRIPFSAPVSGDLELVVRAHRELDEASKLVDLQLPAPRGQSVGAAMVVVSPSDDIDLVPNPAECVGLSQQFTRPEMSLPVRQQPALVYRADRADARFVASYTTHTRVMTVNVVSRIDLNSSGGDVEQTLSYTIAREPVDSLTLALPAAVADDDSLDVTLDGSVLEWERIDVESSDAAQPVRIRVRLPSQRIGPCELKVAYDLPEDEVPTSGSVERRIPLAMPADGQLLSNLARVDGSRSIRVRAIDGLWSIVADPLNTSRSLELTSTAGRSELRLDVRRADASDRTPGVVDRAWIQSWLGRTVRQDRAVYRLLTPLDALHVKLPQSAMLLAALVDGKPVNVEEGISSEELTIPLGSRSARQRPVVVELNYRFPTSERSPGVATLDAPQVDRGVEIRRQYWQVVLSGDEHLISASDTLTPEFRWTWRGAYWGRSPVMDQSQLENWCGASQAAPLPPSSHRYLFSSEGEAASLTVTSMARSTLVLIASGLVLLVGLLVIYVPAVRHPAFRVAALVVLAAVATLYPEPALVLAQAAGIGLVLVGLAGWLKGTVSRVPATRVVATSTASSILERSSTRTQSHRQQLTGSHTTTATAVSGDLPYTESQP